MNVFKPGTRLSDEQIQAARDMSTCEVISAITGFSFERAGSEWKCKEHNSLRVFKDGKGWIWYSQNISGATSIDFLMKSEGYSWQQAVTTLTNGQYTPSSYSYHKDEQPEKPKQLNLPERTPGKYSRVYAYLMKQRCIDVEVINYCVKNEILYEDKRGNCVFVGKDDTGKPKYAMLRGTYTPDKGQAFKGEASGSNKMYGFRMDGTCETHLYVFEAPIDALSHATLNIQRSKDMGIADWKNSWKRHTRLALGGTADVALGTYLATHPKVNEISFCLDRDEAGRTASAKYLEKYSAQGYKVNIYAVPENCGKDYNEYLCKVTEHRKNVSRQMSASYNKQHKTTAILAAFCSVNAFAADNDGWTNFFTFGDKFATNLQKGLVTVATIAVVVLAIMVISGGRNWVDKLKSIGGGILVGIAIGCYGVGIVAGMFA